MGAPLPEALEALAAAERLPPEFLSSALPVYRSLAEAIETRHSELARSIVVGLCGPQGSGKSTMSRFLRLLLEDRGLRCPILSLDDLYLTREERLSLAARVHPLLRTRGVPGTHDVALGLDIIERLLTGPGAVRIPRFDKSIDTRAPEARWHVYQAPVDVVIFEGWCVGARPQAEADLALPVNALEREEDGDGKWRRHVNARLAGDYQTLFARIDYLVMLRPPGFECVLEWRTEQEAKLKESVAAGAATELMSRDGIRRFIMHYERITRALLAEMPVRADAVIDIGGDQRIEQLVPRAGRG